MDLGVFFRFHGMQNCNCLAQLQPLEGGGGRHGTHRIIKATESCKSDTASDRSERIPFPFGFLFTDGNTVDAPQSIPSCSGKKSQDVSTADRLSSTNLWASWDARACGAWSSRSRSDRFQGSDDYHSPLKKMYISELKAKYQVRGPTLIRNFSGGMAKPASRSARSAAPRELWHALATDSESKEFGEKCLSWAVLSDSGLQAKHRIQCFPSFKSLIKLGSCRSSRLLSCWNSKLHFLACHFESSLEVCCSWNIAHCQMVYSGLLVFGTPVANLKDYKSCLSKHLTLQSRAKPCKTLTHAWGCLQKITKIHSWSWFPHISPMNMAILIVPGVPSSIILWPSGGRRRQSDCWLPIRTTSAKSMFLQSFWVECSLHMVCCSKKKQHEGSLQIVKPCLKEQKETSQNMCRVSRDEVDGGIGCFQFPDWCVPFLGLSFSQNGI